MAPKKQAVDKAKIAAKQKAAEDKTFGLKNKNKSKKVAQYVQSVQQSSAQVGDRKQQKLDEKAAQLKKEKKAAEEARKKELEELFAVAIKQPKVPVGVDPKSIVCEFFRHGQCTKGFKCKFSHDLSVERKTAKIDLYTDRREGAEGGEEEGMEDWDQDTLEKVVKEKHGAEKPSNATTIICKFFLEAVEKRQYGWFWKCPNGVDCKYKHALPPGYVLKSQMKELLEEEAARAHRDMSEVVEEERRKVEAKTPITQEVFAAWHARRTEAHRKKREEEDEVRRKKGVLNGREIFLQDNFVAQDDAGADEAYVREDDDEAQINDMFEAARLAQEEARASAAAAEEAAAAAAAAAEGGAGAEEAAAAAAVGPSSSGAAAAGSSSGASSSRAAGAGAGSSSGAAATTLRLDEADAALFDYDDDDDEEDMEDDG